MNKSIDKNKLEELILQAFENGNITTVGEEGLEITNLEEFIKQPIESILYDLNRDEATILTFIDTDLKWVNDYAVCKVIRALKNKLNKDNNKNLK